jgi:hypothetical protein
MGKLQGSLLILYLTAAAAYGGWRGPDLLSDWGVWCFLLPPLAWWAFDALAWRRRNGPIQVALVMAVVAVVAIGGQALVLAWMAAEATGRWSSEPLARALAGVGLLAATGALLWVAKTFGKPAKAREANGSVDTVSPAEPGAAPDPGGR